MPANNVRSVFNLRSGIIATAVFVAVFALVFLLLPQSWLGYGTVAAAVLGIVSAVLVGYAVGRIEMIRQERIPEQWMTEIIPDHQWISDELWQNTCFILGRAGTMATKSPSERSLKVILRKSRYFVFLQLFPVVALSVLLLGMMLGVTVYRNQLNLTSSYIADGWLLLLVIAPLFYVGGWIRLIPWLYEFVAVDDGNLFICKIPPAWLFWLDRSITPYRLGIGQAVKVVSQGFIANTVDCGIVEYATLLQDSEDYEIRQIRFMPNVHQLRDIIDRGIQRSTTLPPQPPSETIHLRPRHIGSRPIDPRNAPPRR